jgi:cytochrome P450
VGTETDLTIAEAQLVLFSPEGLIDEDLWHRAATKLRNEVPISWVDAEGVTPFWAITKHADVLEIELHNNEFLSEPRCILGTLESDANLKRDGHLVKSLVQMDDPEHRLHRNVTSEWFLPKNLAKLEGRLDELADLALDKMRAAGGEIDFAADIAMQYPLQVILAILGLPESDYGMMLRLTQEMFAPDDSDFKRDEDAMAGLMQTLMDLFNYFTNLTVDRRANPGEDLASVIANAHIDGSPMGDKETLGYYIIAATAGHDTTSNSMAGAMKALLDNPDQMKRLQDDPSLMGTAVDEMIRWTSPVKHFMRTAARDYELSGVTIKEGQDVYLSYWSANRDEDVFEDPFAFDITRSPNKHLAFGFGVHYCLGAMLARMELKALFGKILPHLASVEQAGDSALTKSGFVSGVKRLPIRYTLK